MGLYMNLGNKSFQSCIKGEFVDKSPVLAEFNRRLGTQFVIIIDEWDAIFRE